MKRLFLLLALLALPRAVAAQPAETVEYYGSDAIGSIRIAWDANGNVIGRQDHSPFGKPLFTVPSMPKEGFTGQEKDDETDQGYFHARMFQFRIGRFGAPDPMAVLENPQSLNRYSYALNNPESIVDPEGLLAAAEPDCTWVEIEVEGGLSAELQCKLKKGDSGGGGGGGSSFWADWLDFLSWAGMHTVDTLLGTEAVGGDEIVPTASTAYKPSPTAEKVVDAALLVVAVAAPVKGALANVAAKEAAAVAEKAVVSEAAARLAANNAKGGAFEKQVLNALGVQKNTVKVKVPGLGNSIPDGLSSSSMLEIKNVGELSNSKQFRIQLGALAGRDYTLVVSPSTYISQPLENAVANNGGSIVVFNPSTGGFTPWVRK